MPFDPAREVEPVQFAWHTHVAEHEVNRPVLVEGRDCVSGIAGLEDKVAGIAQRFRSARSMRTMGSSSTTRIVGDEALSLACSGPSI